MVGSRKTRRGITLIELVVVVGIIGVLVGMVLVGVQKARESAKHMICVNNLRQIGVACHHYHDTMLFMPSETGSAYCPAEGLYMSLLPYIEQQGLAQMIQQGDAPAKQTPIALFVCPSRRSPTAPYRDYVYLKTFTPILNNPVFGDPAGPIKLEQVSSCNGTEKTALLGHSSVRPTQYAAVDVPWTSSRNYNVNATQLADVESPGASTTPGAPDSCQGGPHIGVDPMLFADGHVQNIPFNWANDPRNGNVRFWMWNWNNVYRYTLP